MIIKIFVVGWGILIVAIILNFIAVRLEIWTWYQFVEEAMKSGTLKAFTSTSTSSKLFLVVIYPLLLGLSSFLILQKFK